VTAPRRDPGLYGDDAALDVVAALVEIVDPGASPAHLSVGLGLRAWMQPDAIEDAADGIRRLIESHAAWLDLLPAAAGRALRRLAADPLAFIARGSRSAALTDLLGSAADGPRVDALFRVPGAPAVLATVAARAIARLDELAASDGDLPDLHPRLAPIGVLLELRALGITVPRGHATVWRLALDRFDRATRTDRALWDPYADRARRALAQL
jgi:hypothetical protein